MTREDVIARLTKGWQLFIRREHGMGERGDMYMRGYGKEEVHSLWSPEAEVVYAMQEDGALVYGGYEVVQEQRMEYHRWSLAPHVPRPARQRGRVLEL